METIIDFLLKDKNLSDEFKKNLKEQEKKYETK